MDAGGVDGGVVGVGFDDNVHFLGINLSWENSEAVSLPGQVIQSSSKREEPLSFFNFLLTSWADFPTLFNSFPSYHFLSSFLLRSCSSDTRDSCATFHRMGYRRQEVGNRIIDRESNLKVRRASPILLPIRAKNSSPVNISRANKATTIRNSMC